MQAMKHGNLIDRARQTQTQAVEIQAEFALDRALHSRQAEARRCFRRAMREYVTRLKASGSSLESVLQMSGRLMRRLRASGEAPDDLGTLEAEVLRVAAEEYCAAA